MKAAVLHVNTCKADSTSPTMRIARFAATTLGVPLIHDTASADKAVGKKFDVLFVVFGVLKFSSHREQALRLYGDAKRIVRLENDYLFKPDPRFAKLHPTHSVWSTVPHSVAERGGWYVNWNTLTPAPLRQRPYVLYADMLIYYGAFKEVRVPSFEKYLFNAPYDVVVASYRVKKFTAEHPELKTVHLRHLYDAAQYAATVYMEDEYSHGMYTSPGTRFYECLAMGLPMFFDVATFDTMLTAGVDVSEYVVSSKKDVKRMLPRAATVGVEQRRKWVKHLNVESVTAQIRAAVACL